MDFKTIGAELSKPFAPEDLEWRLQLTNKAKTRGLAVPYVTNRAIQDRLDDVVGAENWHNEYRPWHGNGKKESQICGISIYVEERKEWITKWDGAEDTDIEAIKGGLSDSMKRAAVQWGVGRVLYKLDALWVDVEQQGNSTVIKDSERSRLDRAYLEMLKKLGLEPAQPGGLQSQLTPRAETARQSGGPDTPPSPAPARPQQQTPPAGETPGNIVPMPGAQRPVREFLVKAANIQNGMSGATTSLTLQGQDGKDIRAYRRGVAADLVPGAELYQVKLAVKRQDSVAFYVLESYKVIAGAKHAA